MNSKEIIIAELEEGIQKIECTLLEDYSGYDIFIDPASKTLITENSYGQSSKFDVSKDCQEFGALQIPNDCVMASVECGVIRLELWDGGRF